MEGTAVALLSAVIPILLFMVDIVGGKAQHSSAPAPIPVNTGKKSGKHYTFYVPVPLSLSSLVLINYQLLFLARKSHMPLVLIWSMLICCCAGMVIDQGIAYSLMFVALLLTYFLHWFSSFHEIFVDGSIHLLLPSKVKPIHTDLRGWRDYSHLLEQFKIKR